MRSIGEGVAVICEGQRLIGEVVGVTSFAQVSFYDVALEDRVLLGIGEKDVLEISASEVQSLLGLLLQTHALARDPQSILLRKRYIETLSRVLSVLGDSQAENNVAVVSLYEVGQEVAIRVEDGYQTGTVLGILRVDKDVQYDVETMGDVVRMPQERLLLSNDIPRNATFALGDCVRFKVAGHELDEDYVGVICMWNGKTEDERYAISFEDGDILVDLTVRDLARV